MEGSLESIFIVTGLVCKRRNTVFHKALTTNLPDVGRTGTVYNVVQPLATVMRSRSSLTMKLRSLDSCVFVAGKISLYLPRILLNLMHRDNPVQASVHSNVLWAQFPALCGKGETRIINYYFYCVAIGRADTRDQSDRPNHCPLLPPANVAANSLLLLKNPRKHFTHPDPCYSPRRE